jgi:hypothetical protein
MTETMTLKKVYDECAKLVGHEPVSDEERRQA